MFAWRSNAVTAALIPLPKNTSQITANISK
jgi:hypothetical protein